MDIDPRSEATETMDGLVRPDQPPLPEERAEKACDQYIKDHPEMPYLVYYQHVFIAGYMAGVGQTQRDYSQHYGNG